MSNDKDKLLEIMASLESDYAHGKISREKYIYFRSKYEDRLNALDAREATNRIRSMQGKPSNSPKKERPVRNERKEEDLVQKYIINPKKGDRKVKEKTPMDSGTYKLLAILILAIGFTVGAGFGVFSFDFASFSDTNASAIVTDTAFPDVADIHVNKTSNVTTSYNSSNVQVETTSDTSYVPDSGSSSDRGGSSDSGGGSQGGGGSSDSGGGSQGGGGTTNVG